MAEAPARRAGQSQPRPGRRERRRAETRRQILRAALRLFAERGLAATTVEDITEAADVGKGTFFNYFPSKAHVLAAFGAMQMEKARTALVEARAGRESFRQGLRRLWQAIAEEPARTPGLARSLISALLISDEARKLVGGRLALGLDKLARAVAVAQQRGEIRADLPAAGIARYILQSYFGTVLMWTLFPEVPLERRLDRSVELTWAAIASPKTGNHRS
jgi:AcrR family transcriptional regulator